MSKKDRAKGVKNTTLFRRIISILVVTLNVILLVVAVLFYSDYFDAYDTQLKKENIANVSNLNKSAIINSTSLFDSFNTRVMDLEQYIERNELTLDEALRLATDENSGENRYFQFVSSDYTGYLAAKDESGEGYVPLNYSAYSYSNTLQPIFADSQSELEGIHFMPEFTDAGTTGMKFFAVYRYVTLKGEEKPWTIMLAVRSSYVVSVLNALPGYDGQATVIISANGSFVVNNKYFTSTNFYDYIRERNDLTFEERNGLAAELQSNQTGELYYKKLHNTVNDDFVFCYERMATLNASDWYCVTCVPLSAFKAPDFSINSMVYLLLIVFLVFVADVLWLSSMNRRLKQSMLREKDASLAKGSFLSRMSHEIRTPLNAVIGYNTIARNELTNLKPDADFNRVEAKITDSLEKSAIASRHLLSIINDVLDMSAIESGKIKIARERFDFKGLITSLTTVFYSQAQSKGVTFEVKFESLTEEWFIGDQVRTNQILTNLLSNAIKFTPEGGKVTLRIDQPEVTGNFAHVHFSVSDTGIGMSPEYLNHIWQPFEQEDASISRRFGGTGLGLSITKNLVDVMDGTVTVESEQGKGTAFDVDLTYELANTAAHAESYDFGKISALVVDDDVATCDYVRLLFNSCGAKCAVAYSGEDAIREVTDSVKNSTPYSICIVDGVMPNMDGIETVARIRELVGESLPVFVLTAYDFSELADNAAEIGITKFISKPLFRSSLFDLLVTYCDVQEPSRRKAASEYDFKGMRILLAEDNAMNMEIASALLTGTGFVVDSVWDGVEAVETFSNSPAGTYKAILMDIHMPKMNGLDAARTIRTSDHTDAQTVPIIAMTADAFAENIAEALSAGMNGHVSKPIDLSVLFKTLKDLISQNNRQPLP